MLEEGKITPRQAILMVFTSRIIISITLLPVLAAPPANQDVWLSYLGMFPIELILAAPIFLLWKRFPDQTLIEYSRIIAGKAGAFIGLLFIIFFTFYSASAICQFNTFLVTAVMPETPVLFFAITFVLVCGYAVYNGLEVLGRLAELFAPIIMLALILIFMLLLKDMDLKTLQPVLEKGVFPSLYGGLSVAALTVEILGLAMILPYLNNQKKTKQVFLGSLLLMLIFFLLIVLPVLLTLGSHLAKTQTFPYFSAVRTISVADFIERIEAVHIGIWILGGVIKASFFYYLAVLGLGQLFKLKDYKPLILPLGTIIVPLCITMAPSIAKLRAFTSYKVFTWYSLFFILVLPLVLLLIAVIRKKGKTKA